MMATGNERSIYPPIKIKAEILDTNGVDTTIQRPGRLTTFKVPRDLTLGGTGPLRSQRGNANKKVYTPNLNVTRNKNLQVRTSKDGNGRTKGRIDRGKISERGGRGRNNRGGLVQMSGLFSEGAGVIQPKRAAASYRAGSRENEDLESLRRPTLIKYDGKIDILLENQRIQDILGDSDEEDIKDERGDQEFVPIKLIEGENEIITEKISLMNIKAETATLSKSQVSDRYPSTLEEFFSRTLSQLFLMQLPDSLPCQEVDTSEKHSTVEAESNQTVSKCTLSVLNDLEEGQIGKIMRYRSGKFKLILGEMGFELDLGTESGFLQETMSICTNREERSGNMISLGPIQSKIEVTPSWDFLIKNN